MHRPDAGFAARILDAVSRAPGRVRLPAHIATALAAWGFALLAMLTIFEAPARADALPARVASASVPVASVASVASVAPSPPIDRAVAPGGGVPAHPGSAAGPVRARIGVLASNLRAFDVKAGTYEGDFFVSLTSDAPMPELHLSVPNGKIDTFETIADKPTFKAYRVLGTFSSRLDLRDYPFDTQALVFELEDDLVGSDRLLLLPDNAHTNLDVGFALAGWGAETVEARIVNHKYPDRFENDDLYYARYELKIGLRRYPSSAIFSVFVPALVIVLISLSGLFLPRDKLAERSSATTPMLAAAVAFHLALDSNLPATAYLTRADKLMIAVYAVLFLHMVATWLWFFVDERHTERIFVLGKWLGVPVTFALLAAGVLA